MTVMRKLKARSLVALGLLLALLVTSFPLTAMAGGPTLNAVEITPDDRAYDWVTAGKQTYTYDFTSTEITDYSTDEVLATASLRTNMIFDGQTLACKEGKTYSFASVSHDNVVLDTVKQAENVEGTVLRFYECQNARTKATVTVPTTFTKAYATNLLEQVEQELTIVDGKVTFTIKPYEIYTILLK